MTIQENKNFLIGAVAVFVFLVTAVIVGPRPGMGELHAAAFGSVSSPWSEGWYENAEGYEEAMAEHKRTGKPMGVYMTVTWCPYCRQFEKRVLSSSVVKDYLKDKILVSINPEAGRRENVLAYRYRVTGFPTFYVHRPGSERVTRLYLSGTPREFIQEFEDASK
ncbi:MAG: thioredoxin family protein [Candidatus Omnitrophica bacterium]|nr:thioredoxin family protein [Candidatus Omnitrophota bacterium]